MRSRQNDKLASLVAAAAAAAAMAVTSFAARADADEHGFGRGGPSLRVSARDVNLNRFMALAEATLVGSDTVVVDEVLAAPGELLLLHQSSVAPSPVDALDAGGVPVDAGETADGGAAGAERPTALETTNAGRYSLRRVVRVEGNRLHLDAPLSPPLEVPGRRPSSSPSSPPSRSRATPGSDHLTGTDDEVASSRSSSTVPPSSTASWMRTGEATEGHRRCGWGPILLRAVVGCCLSVPRPTAARHGARVTWPSSSA